MKSVAGAVSLFLGWLAVIPTIGLLVTGVFMVIGGVTIFFAPVLFMAAGPFVLAGNGLRSVGNELCGYGRAENCWIFAAVGKLRGARSWLTNTLKVIAWLLGGLSGLVGINVALTSPRPLINFIYLAISACCFLFAEALRRLSNEAYELTDRNVISEPLEQESDRP